MVSRSTTTTQGIMQGTGNVEIGRATSATRATWVVRNLRKGCVLRAMARVWEEWEELWQRVKSRRTRRVISMRVNGGGLCGDNNAVVSSSSSRSATVDASQTASASGWLEEAGSCATGAKSPSAGAPVAWPLLASGGREVGERWAISELGAKRMSFVTGMEGPPSGTPQCGISASKPKTDQPDSRFERRKAWTPGHLDT